MVTWLRSRSNSVSSATITAGKISSPRWHRLCPREVTPRMTHSLWEKPLSRSMYAGRAGSAGGGCSSVDIIRGRHLRVHDVSRGEFFARSKLRGQMGSRSTLDAAEAVELFLFKELGHFLPGGPALAEVAEVARLVGKLQVRRGQGLALRARPHRRLDDAGCQQGALQRVRLLPGAEQVHDRVRQGHEQVAIAPGTDIEAGSVRVLVAGELA